jgi:Xaa-Pro dipeptidase
MTLMPSDEHANRTARARELMRERKIDCLIVTDPINYSYFTGQNVSLSMRARPSIFILPIEGHPALITWSGPDLLGRLNKQPFPSWVADRRIYPEVPFTNESRVDWGIFEVLRERGLESGTLGIELGRNVWLGIALTDYELLRERLPKARFVDSGPVVWGCRLIKSEWEINCMRQACEIGGRAWQRVFGELRLGVSASTVQRKSLDYYFDEGADLNSEPPMVLGATGPNRTFQEGDVLFIDGGATYSGYKMDYARRAVFGPPSTRQKSEHDGMWGILWEIIDRMKPGTSTRELFEFSQKRLARHPQWKNYSDHPSKRIGHGIGLENEPPSISGTDEAVLEIGMALTPEPKIESLDGLLNPEEHVVVRSDRCEVLSSISDWHLYTVE